MSYNIRGVGSDLKRREVQELIFKQKIDMICIQESKLELVNEVICHSVWGRNNCGWAAMLERLRGGLEA